MKGLTQAREPMQVLVAIQARDIRVGTARAQMGACLAATGVTSAANRIFQCLEGMFHPGLADLFEALVVICASAHAIQVLWNERMIGLRQRKPIDRLVSIVARVCAYCQPNLG